MPGPHQGQPIIEAGVPLQEASVAVILVHGRGASGQSMLRFAEALDQTKVAYHAMQAAANSWYPYSFLAPLESNEPAMSSGIQAIDETFLTLEAAGLPPDKIVLLGFSQGACLSLEYAARHPRRMGGVIAWSGGLIGTNQIPGQQPPNDKSFDYAGDLKKTPVFLGCSDIDQHIPVTRVHQTAAAMNKLGATVTCEIYPGMGHTVNADELRFARSLLSELAG